jgi:hypothetical protein|tara:strand:+ start:1558 stop:2658 length:1101 start_codon:yes stop_codon:yes gene_type:complete
MSEDIISLIRPEIKTSNGGRVAYYNLDPLSEALSSDENFMSKARNCNFDWPDEGTPISALAHWLLEETQRTGDPREALTRLHEFMAAPRRTWQQAIVCTNVIAQHKNVREGWEFENGVVAHAAGLSSDHMILSDDQLVGMGLILLDQNRDTEYSDFILRATDCCRALSFVADKGSFIRPTYHTLVYETAAPHPLGSSKGWLTDRRNKLVGLLTAEMFEQADNLVQKMHAVSVDDLPVLRRVMDRHAAAVVWGDLENRAIEARICMEMILMTGAKGDNSFKVSRRAAYLMSDDLNGRRERMRQAIDLYGAGSKAVHEGVLTKEKDINAVRSCHEFLDELVTAWLDHGAIALTDKEWAEVELGGDFPS